MPSYDVCIPFHPKDRLILEYCIPSIHQHLPEAKNIYVVSKEDPNLEEIIWIPESSYPFTMEDVASIIHSKTRIGWYFQQLLKLYCYRALPSESNNILILDSDVIIKKHIQFFNDTKILMAISPECHQPYYNHMERILPGLTKQTQFSGIVHHIMTNRYHMEELLSKIEEFHGKHAWMALLELVNPDDYDFSGMADYEIYFNYCLKYHPDDYQIYLLQFGNFHNFEDFVKTDVYLGALHSWIRE
jgi:hypothetical protein